MVRVVGLEPTTFGWKPKMLPITLYTHYGAENEIRTRDINLGKVTLYQLSYFRILQLFGAQYRIRTDVGFSSKGFAIRRIQPDSANCA